MTVGSIFSLIALFLFSLNVFVVRSASAHIGQRIGFLFAMGANVAFGATLFVIHSFTRDTAITWDWAAFGVFGLAGVFASYLGRRGFFRSVETLGTSRASAIQITNPVFAAALAWVLLGEALDGLTISFIALAILGLYLNTLTATAGTSPRESGLTRKNVSTPLSLVWPALLASAAYAVGNILRAHAIDAWDEPILGGLVGACAATVAYTVFHIRRGEFRDLSALDRNAARGLYLWILAGGLTISAQISVIAAMAHSPVAVVLVISSALPIVVVPVNLLVLRNVEQLRTSTVAGSILVLAGVTGVLLR